MIRRVEIGAETKRGYGSQQWVRAVLSALFLSAPDQSLVRACERILPTASPLDARNSLLLSPLAPR